MDKTEQLTFSDDPLLNGLNLACSYIERGAFKDAADIIDKLMDTDPDYPGLAAGYRTAKFWFNRADEISRLAPGRETGDFLMSEWKNFEEYSKEKKITESRAFNAAMKYIYYEASSSYKQVCSSGPNAANMELLMNLGFCFLKSGDYQEAVKTLKTAAGQLYNPDARLLSILAEACFHLGQIPDSLWYFREAFFIEPSAVDIDALKAEPVIQLVNAVRKDRPDCRDVREWIPVYGFLTDIFYVRKNLDRRQIDLIKDQCYSLEVNYQRLNREQLAEGKTKPRLITRYLWLMDFFEFQEYSLKDLKEIKERLLQIDEPLLQDYLNKIPGK